MSDPESTLMPMSAELVVDGIHGLCPVFSSLLSTLLRTTDTDRWLETLHPKYALRDRPLQKGGT